MLLCFFFFPFIIFLLLIILFFTFFLVFLFLSHLSCSASPSPQWEPMLMNGNIKESYTWWMEWPLGFSHCPFSLSILKILSLSHHLSPTVFLLLSFFSSFSHPSRYCISEWDVAVMSFLLKLTHLLCPWPNQVIHLLLVCFWCRCLPTN